MALAIFDLDKTLIGGDSDFLWGEFLSQIGAVDKNTYQAKNRYFFEQYDLGKLDINEYLEFCLKPLSQNPISVLNKWHKEFIEQKINPIILTKAQQMVDFHRKKGDTLLVITATNRFITTPIVAKFGIKNLLATEPEIKNGRYTGRVVGEPCFQNGKIIHLQNWLKKTDKSLKGSTFYSDSFNDLPLLKLVDNPVAVNADNNLFKTAKQKNWKILDWA